jgi:outer membrane protein
MIVRLRLLTLVCTSLLATSATQVCAQSLEAALSQAYMSNPTLNAQRAAARAFDENVPQALGGYRPTLEGTADVSIDTTRSTAREGLPGMSRTSTTTLFPRGVGLQATQNLFNGFRTGNSVRAAESGVLGQRESLRNIEQNILLDAVTAYMNVLRDAAVLNLAQNNVEVLEEQLRQTQDRFDVGEVTRTDVEQAKASVAGARSEMLGAQAQLKSSTAIYRQVIGSEPRRLGPGRSIEKLIPKRLESAIAAGLKIHPAITAALHAVDVAALQVKVAEGALYPSLNATSSVSQRWDAGNSLESTNFTVGAFLSVPIYEGGVDYSRIRQAKETLGQRRIEADVTREQVRAAVVSAWGVLEASIAQISATQAQVAAAEVALSGVREEAKVGQRTTLDVLNQQQGLLNARVALVTAQRDRVVAAYSLLSAIGKLTAKTLRLKVTEYDPGIHYDQVRNKWIGTNTPDGR